MDKILLLIDAENFSSKNFEKVFNKLSEQGVIVSKQIYGDFALTNLKSWQEEIFKYSLNIHHKPTLIKGKNSSDIYLAIHAVLEEQKHDIQTVAICSSDSDFSALSLYFRQKGKKVVGFGDKSFNTNYAICFDEFVDLSKEAKEKEEILNPINYLSSTSFSYFGENKVHIKDELEFVILKSFHQFLIDKKLPKNAKMKFMDYDFLRYVNKAIFNAYYTDEELNEFIKKNSLTQKEYKFIAGNDLLSKMAEDFLNSKNDGNLITSLHRSFSKVVLHEHFGGSKLSSFTNKCKHLKVEGKLAEAGFTLKTGHYIADFNCEGKQFDLEVKKENNMKPLAKVKSFIKSFF